MTRKAPTGPSRLEIQSELQSCAGQFLKGNGSFGTQVDSARALVAASKQREVRAAIRGTVDCLRELSSKRRWGRYAGLVASAYAVCPDHFALLQRAGVLWDGRLQPASPRKALQLLLEHSPPSFDRSFRTTVRSFLNLEELFYIHEKERRKYVKVIRSGATGLVRFAATIAELTFCEEVSPRLRERIESRWGLEVGPSQGREGVVSILSLLLSDIRQIRRLSLKDLAVSSSESLENSDFMELLRYASIRAELRSAGFTLQFMPFELDRLAGGCAPTYRLKSRDPQLEEAIQDGLITTQIQMALRAEKFDSKGLPTLSAVADRAGRLLEDAGLITVETLSDPAKRLRISIQGLPELPRLLMSATRDREHQQRYMLEDLLLRPNEVEQLVLTDGVRLTDALEAVDALRIYVALYRGAAIRGAGEDEELLVNSMHGILTREQLIAAVRSLNDSLEERTIERALGLITWDGDRGRLDLQYQPILRISDMFILLPRVLQDSNLLRNLLVATSKRPDESGDAFTEHVRSVFEKANIDAVSEKKIVLGKGQTLRECEIDVVCWLDGELLFVECKHSVQGTETTEFRPTWEHLEKATGQLGTARRLWEEDPLWDRRFRGWFPGLAVPDVRPSVRALIVQPVRVFSGSSSGGIPVRDIHTLHNTLLDGVLSMTRSIGNERTQVNYRYWNGEVFSVNDLLDYLEPNGRFWRCRRLLLKPSERTLISRPGYKMTRATYGAEFGLDQEWWDELERSIQAEGCVKMNERTWQARSWEGELNHALAVSRRRLDGQPADDSPRGAS